MAKKSIDYREHLLERLKDTAEAVEYLKATLEESDMPELFLVALKDVAEARGMSQLAKAAHLNRENLYKILSEHGNPEFKSLHAILDALGLRLSIEMKKAS